jgi:hypothetical protein
VSSRNKILPAICTIPGGERQPFPPHTWHCLSLLRQAITQLNMHPSRKALEGVCVNGLHLAPQCFLQRLPADAL